jgi:endonuclease/exonuclease/phosphatase family metal-dependent hydrolase
MIDSIHLNDIPAPFHLLKKVPYEGHSKKDYHLTCKQIREWSAKVRIPEIEPYLRNHFKKRSIICGDFNETSGWPVSEKMKKYGYIDLGEKINKKTWPAYPFYQGEPSQRIDFIYARGVQLIQSSQFYKRKNWLSDHVAVISDVFL